MAFLAGQWLTAQALNDHTGVAKQHAPLDSGTTSSAGYTTSLTGGTSPVFTPFTAPPSGKVEVSWGVGIVPRPLGFGLCAVQVRVGNSATSGTIFHAAADNLAIQLTEDSDLNEAQIGRSYIFEGLTPFLVYNVALAYRIGGGAGGTSIFARKQVSAKPIPG